MHMRVIRHGRLLLLAALFVGLVQGRASAAPLNLWVGTPDITASGLNFYFDSLGNVRGAGAAYTLCYTAAPAFISSFGLSPEITDAVPYQLIAAGGSADRTADGRRDVRHGQHRRGVVDRHGLGLRVFVRRGPGIDGVTVYLRDPVTNTILQTDTTGPNGEQHVGGDVRQVTPATAWIGMRPAGREEASER